MLNMSRKIGGLVIGEAHNISWDCYQKNTQTTFFKELITILRKNGYM